MVDKLNKNINGYSISDELHTDVGSASFRLNHDTIVESSFEIWTGASQSGTQLTTSDYNLVNEDTDLSNEKSEPIYTEVEITNSTYQTGDLYFTYTTLGDYAEAVDINNLFDVAIVEHNLNVSSPSNGYYVRWDNGLQVCFLSDTRTVDIDISSSTIDYRTDFLDINLPSSFADNNFRVFINDASGGFAFPYSGEIIDYNTIEIAYGKISSNTNVSVSASILTIGRWK